MRDIGDGIIIIPDVHGRKFWREAVGIASGKHIVFLGDYADPFPEEDIPAEQAIRELEAIISLKCSRPNETTLLLGNHDLQYFWPDFPKTRYDYEHSSQYASMFMANRDCFDFTASFHAHDLVVILTHAGILPGWLKDNSAIFGLDDGNAFASADFNKPNLFWHERDDVYLCNSLSSISTMRGGDSDCGSMVWADAREMIAAPETPGVFQIFGHTRQNGDPLITSGFACVDCKKAFLLDKDGNLTEAQ